MNMFHRMVEVLLVALFSIILATIPTTVSAFSPLCFDGVFPTSRVLARTATATALHADTNEVDEDGISRSERDDGNNEWRSFRARLVRDGLPFLGDDPNALNTASTANTNDDTDSPDQQQHRYAHESANLVEVGTILLSIPTTDLCQGLEQQYWHRSVVLVTAISEDRVNGDEETEVPKAQLAQGAGRGRWSYRGIFLNRMTDFVLDDDNKNEWRIWYGGDLAPPDTNGDHSEFQCIHSLNEIPTIRNVSTKLVGKLHLTTLDHARSLCDATKHSPSDFTTFKGFCSWRPGQLEMEMGEERAEWVALSVDEDSIQEALRLVAEPPAFIGGAFIGVDGHNREDKLVAQRLLGKGTAMWRHFFHLVGRVESQVTDRIPSGQLEFYDQMLAVWAEEALSDNSNDGKEEEGGDIDLNSNRYDNLIGPGTLVRATAHVPNDILLYDQEFIRSIILILEETPEATVGIILNHPLPASLECVEGELSPLPLRYGGPIDVLDWKAGGVMDDDDCVDAGEDDMYEGFADYMNDPQLNDLPDYSEDDGSGGDYYVEEEEEDDSPFIWLHRDPALGSRGGGTPLSTSGLWLIQETELLDALRSGILKQEDTMVFSGVCIWEKDPDLGTMGGGVREHIEALHTLEVVRGYDEQRDRNVIGSMWNILNRRQDVLTKHSLDANINAMIDAWTAVTSDVNAPMGGQSTSREALADAALRGWVAVNLLGDPLETLVEVKKTLGQ